MPSSFLDIPDCGNVRIDTGIKSICFKFTKPARWTKAIQNCLTLIFKVNNLGRVLINVGLIGILDIGIVRIDTKIKSSISYSQSKARSWLFAICMTLAFLNFSIVVSFLCHICAICVPTRDMFSPLNCLTYQLWIYRDCFHNTIILSWRIFPLTSFVPLIMTEGLDDRVSTLYLEEIDIIILL